MKQAKQVILRLREADLNEQDLYKAVRAYFQTKNRPVDELNTQRHLSMFNPLTLTYPRRSQYPYRD